MTSLDALWSRNRSRGNVGFIPSSDPYEATFLERASYWLGKPEEYTTKLIANLVSDDPKYDWSEKSHPFNQVGFASAIRDMDIMPTPVAAIVGLGLAIANPLDPLNKLNVGKLTKLGAVAKEVDAARDVSKLVKGTDGIFSIDKSADLAELDKWRKLAKSLPGGSDEARTAARNVKQLERQSKYTDEINKALKDYQKAGIDIETIRSAPTAWEQARLGQRKLLGFSSPFSLDQLSLFGFGRSPLQQATAVGLPKKLDAALTEGLSKGASAIGSKARDLALAGIARMGFPVVRTAKQREWLEEWRNLQKKHTGGAHIKLNEFHGLINKHLNEGATKEDLIELSNYLENPLAPQHAGEAFGPLVRQVIDSLNPDPLQFKSAEAVTIGDALRNTVPGSQLTEQGRLLLRPSGLDTDDLSRAKRAWLNQQAPRVQMGERQLLLTDDYMVMEGEIDPALTKGLLGIPEWDRVPIEESEISLLVARRPAAAQKIRQWHDRADAQDFTGTTFEMAHAHDLELITAQLAERKLALGPLSHEDILITPGGHVTIVNPDVLKAAKTMREAREISTVNLNEFLDAVGMPRGSLREFPYLKTNKTAMEAARDAKRLRRTRVASDPVQEGVGFINSWELLRDAENMTAYRQLYRAEASGGDYRSIAQETRDWRDVQRANNVDSWREKIRQDKQAGRKPDIPPIQVGKHPDGWLYIKDGRDRLAAAVLEGVDVVPIKKVDFAGESIDFTHYQIQDPQRLTDIFHHEGELAGSSLPGGFEIPAYKLLDPKGRRVALKETQFETPEARELLRLLSEFVGYHATGHSAARADRFLDTLTRKYGSPWAALVSLSDRMDGVRGFIDYLPVLEEATGLQFTSLKSTRIRSFLSQKWGAIQNALEPYRSALAKRGVFTPKTIGSPDFRKLYPGVVETFDPTINSYVLTSGTKTAAKLHETFEQSVNSRGVLLYEVLPFERVVMDGADDTLSLEVREVIRNLGKQPYEQLKAVVPASKKVHISDEYKAELEKKNIYYNPTTTKLVSEGLHEKSGRVFSDAGTANYVPAWSFFVTEGGGVFVSTRSNVTQLLQDVFGEGPLFAAEFGLVTKDRIVVNNPFGSNLKRAGRGEIKQLTLRIKELARKFKDMGLSGGYRFDVQAPFDQSVWKKMFGENVTIDEVLDKNWKLKLDKQMEGMPLDIVIDAPSAVVGFQRRRFRNERLQALADWLENEKDALFKAEVEANLPVAYRANYWPRYMTVEGQKAWAALNESAEAEIKSLVKKAEHYEQFVHKRMLFPDYSIDDINKIVQDLRKAKLADLKPEELVERVVNRLRDEGDFAMFDKLATELNRINPALDVHFLHQNSAYIFDRRIRDSFSARTRQEFVDGLKGEAALVVRGADMDVLNGRKSVIEGHQQKIAELDREMAELQARKELARQQPLAAEVTDADRKLDEAIEALAKKRGEMRAVADREFEAMVRAHGPLARDIDIRQGKAYVPNSVARELQQRGLLSDAELADQLDSPLVGIDVKKYKDQLGPNTEFVFFTKEMEPVADLVFKSMDRASGHPQKILALHDFVMGLWRNWTLYPIPQYHIRNVFSNTLLLYIGGVTDPESFKTTWTTLHAIKRYRDGKSPQAWEEIMQAMENEILVSPATGRRTNMAELYKAWVNNGGISGGLHYNEFNRFTGGFNKVNEFTARLGRAGMIPSSEMPSSILFDNRALRFGQSLAAGIEDRFRFTAFYDAWKKTGSFDEAALKMKAIMYDYRDMNLFERSVLRRIFPFYSWLRHNIPAQMKALYTNPMVHYRMLRFTQSLERGANEDMPVDEKDLPQWVRDRYGVVIAKDANGNWVVRTLDGIWPATDVFKMLGNPMSMLNDSLTPALKFPAEVIANTSFFTGRQIKEVPGQPARSWTLSSLGFTAGVDTQGALGPLNILFNEHAFRTAFRAGGIVTKLLDHIFDERNYRTEKPGLAALMADLLIGRSYTIDPQQTRLDLYKDWDRKRGRIESYIKWSTRVGDRTGAEHGRKLLFQLDLRAPWKD